MWTTGNGGRWGSCRAAGYDRCQIRTVWLLDMDTHLAGIEHQCANVAVTGTFNDVDGVGGRDAGDDDVTLFLKAHDQL